MKQAIFASLTALTLAGCFLLAACAGGNSNGGGNNNNGTNTFTITGVSVTCSPQKIAANGVFQCSATVSGTGNYSSAVTWSANGPGTIDQTGKGTGTAVGVIMITATSVTDSNNSHKSGTATVTVVAAPTIGSFSANPSQVDSGGTSTLSWSGVTDATSISIDNGIGSFPPADGSATTPPLTQDTTFTLTATGVGGTATATATVTVNKTFALTVDPPGPYFFPCGYDISGRTVTFHVTPAINDGDTIKNSLFGDEVYHGPQVSDVKYLITFHTPGCILGDQNFQIVRASDGAKTNVVPAEIIGNQNDATSDGSGNHFTLQPGNGDIENGVFVQIYHGNDLGAQFVAPSFHMAWDNATNRLAFVATPNGVCSGDCVLMTYTTDGTFDKELDISGTTGLVVAALNGFGGMTLWAQKEILFSDLTQGSLTKNVVPVNGTPWSIDLAPVNGATDAFATVLDTLSVYRYTNLSATQLPDATLVLTGCKLPSEVAGNWPIATFGSGPAAGIGAVLCNQEGRLFLFDLNTMTAKPAVDLHALIGSNLVPTVFAKDEAHGTLIVLLDDETSVTNQSVIAKVDIVNGTATVLKRVDGALTNVTVDSNRVIHACLTTSPCVDIAQ